MFKTIIRSITSLFILRVTFIDRKQIEFIHPRKTLCVIRAYLGSERKRFDIQFKEDRRKGGLIFRSYIVEAFVCDSVIGRLQELNNLALMSVTCYFPFISKRVIARILIDRYLDEAIQYYETKGS